MCRIADYHVIKTPVDLTLVRERLARTPPYYITPDQLLSDLTLMVENCRMYNDPSTTYWDCATRLEAFIQAFAADSTVVRLPAEGE